MRAADTALESAGLSTMDIYAATEFAVSAGCISVRSQNGKVCLNLPLVGNYCLPVPSWIPRGRNCSAVRASASA